MDDLQDHTLQRPVLVSMLGQSVDYAGFFPPASLSLPSVLERYTQYSRSSHAWMLGRLVLPRNLCQEADDLLRQAGDFSDSEPCELSIVLSAANSDEAAWVSQHLQSFVACHAVAVEAKWSDEEAVKQFAGKLPAAVSGYIEVPLDRQLDDRIALLSEHSLYAKVRTGGVTADSIPAPRQVAEFFAACAKHRVPCKATAGLHHPLCGVFPLTYEHDAACAPMFGFLNVLAAVITLFKNPTEIDRATTWLGTNHRDGLALNETAWTWLDQQWSPQEMAEVRSGFFHAFGSCSFTEPIEGLAELGLLD